MSTVEELHASARRNFPRRCVSSEIRSVAGWYRRDMPVLELQQKLHMTTVIDVLSKYAWAVPFKSKDESEMADAIVEIIRASERCSKNLQWIWRRSFTTQIYRKSWKNTMLIIILMYSTLKKSMVERFNHTLKNGTHVEDIYNQWQLQVGRWAAASRITLQRAQASHYQHATRRYNLRERLMDTVYSTIKIKTAGNQQNSKWVIRFAWANTRRFLRKMEKSNWTTKVFTIDKVQRANLVTYLLEENPWNVLRVRITLLIRICISWRKYWEKKEIKCTSCG